MKKYLALAIIGLSLFGVTEAWSQASANPTKLTLFKKHNVSMSHKVNLKGGPFPDEKTCEAACMFGMCSLYNDGYYCH